MTFINKINRKLHTLSEIRESKYVLKQIANYLLNLDVHILYVQLPKSNKIKGLTEFEQERIKNWCFDFNKYKKELSKLKMLYGEDITQEYILSVFDGGVVVDGAKRKVLLDFQSEHQHIINGRRITVGQPKRYHNTIYTHGACTWRGTGVEDQETIASFLQQLINIDYRLAYRIVNSAIGRGSNIRDDFEMIKEQTYFPGDIVILGSHGAIMNIGRSFFEKIGIVYLTTSSLFNRPHNYGEWFNDTVLHTNKRGNKVLADAIYKVLNEMKWLTSGVLIEEHKKRILGNNKSLTKGERIYGDNPELLKYIDLLRQYKQGDAESNIGCIVMNCNPFTLGHRYLIEYASLRVDYLYIFVVEENRSYFTFDDRFDLVCKGTADLKNVRVLPSGNFIISAITFPGYFYKDNLKEAKIDCSNDLNVFAQYIAPALNIKNRFAGEEPLDPVTNQYNMAMAEILPQYGIQFHVIPRKIEGKELISSSRVRRYFVAGKVDEIKEIVPNATYNYLVNRYNKEHD